MPSSHEQPFENEFPSLAEALLAPVIWAEVWAFTGNTSNEHMLPAMNNLYLAIKYPESQWINPRLREVRDTLVAEITDRIPNVSGEALEYMGDYVQRVIMYYSRNPQLLSEEE